MVNDRVPPSLRVAGLTPVWAAVRDRLETRGVDNRGRVRLPDLDREARFALTGLLGRAPTATVDLGALEEAFRRIGLGDDLTDAIALLGAPVSPASIERRVARQRRDVARDVARATVAEWPVPWASEWVDEVIGAGLLRARDADAAIELIAGVRAVLIHLGLLASASGTPRGGDREVSRAAITSRTGLAASVLGDAHALDRGRTTEAAVVRAIRRALGLGADDDAWSAVGVHPDLVSAPVLTWALPLIDLPLPDRVSGRERVRSRDAPSLATMVSQATAMGVPIHLTAMALRDAVIAVAPGAVVLVAENPRVIEAAAERHVPVGLVCTNGNPSTTVRLLVDRLVRSGVRLLYHGDVDTPGLAICARMHALGALPWRMTSSDYLDALAAADADGVTLPVEMVAPGPTPWDPSLRDVFDAERRIVHEERVLDALLDDLVSTARG